ncbi:MAG: HPr family phosphocarrier protein [Gammaproteobacteria bacterium]
MLTTDITIINKLGLHARAAAKFVTLASSFESDVLLKKGPQEVNGKSIMGVMMLAASRGTALELTTDGEDEKDAAKKLTALINTRFGENE